MSGTLPGLNSTSFVVHPPSPDAQGGGRPLRFHGHAEILRGKCRGP
ncbi:hypothetical protein ACWDFL_38890 [Streptomyces bungoensis]